MNKVIKTLTIASLLGLTGCSQPVAEAVSFSGDCETDLECAKTAPYFKTCVNNHGEATAVTLIVWGNHSAQTCLMAEAGQRQCVSASEIGNVDAVCAEYVRLAI